jgi:hypothetical protein
MAQLKALFPLSYRGTEVPDLIVSIVIYLVIGVVAGVVCHIVGWIPLIGGIVSWLLGLVSGVYVLVGIVLAVLHFLKIGE